MRTATPGEVEANAALVLTKVEALARERDRLRTALDVARTALGTADEAITDAINDYVPCTCEVIVPGNPSSHGDCTDRELLTAMHVVRAAIAKALTETP